jgi:hypothetical protein
MMKTGRSRDESRIEAGEAAKATILGHPDVTVTCRIRDFSRSGMCIAVDRNIACGKTVKVEWDDNFLVGRVQRVSAVGGTFRVGLELLYCSKWNELKADLLASGALFDSSIGPQTQVPVRRAAEISPPAQAVGLEEQNKSSPGRA